MRLAFAILIALMLCSCAPRQYRLHASINRAQLATAPEPPDSIVAAIAPAEIPIPIDPHVIARYIKRDGNMFATQFDGSLLVWLANGQYRVLELPYWQNLFDSESDFAISGDRLAVSCSPDGSSPHMTGQYALTDWSGGLPTRAIYVTTCWWSSSNGRNIRMTRTAAGGLFAVTFQWTGRWILDTTYLPPGSGDWKTDHWVLPWPDDGVPAMGIECEFRPEDGRIYVYPNKDSTGNIGLVRFAEANGGIVLVDSDYTFLDEGDGPLAPDGEFPQVRISNCKLSYAKKDGWIYGCYWRLAHPQFTKIAVMPEAGGWIDPRSFSIEGQSVAFKFTTAPGLTYKPQWSANQAAWTDATVLHRSDSGGVASVSVGRPPGAAVFFRAKSKNYNPEMLWEDADFIERSMGYGSAELPMCTRADGSWVYFINPTKAPECDVTYWYQRQTGSNATESPIDYNLLTYGEGWIMGRRGAACFLKQL